MYTHTYTHTHMHITYTHTHTHTRTSHTHTHTHIPLPHTHAHTHTHTHTHTPGEAILPLPRSSSEIWRMIHFKYKKNRVMSHVVDGYDMPAGRHSHDFVLTRIPRGMGIRTSELKITARAIRYIFCAIFYNGHPKFDHDCIKLCTDGQSKFHFGQPNLKSYFQLWTYVVNLCSFVSKKFFSAQSYRTCSRALIASL